MAFNGNSPLFKHLPVDVNSDPKTLSPPRPLEDNNDKGSVVLRWLNYEVFRKDCLDRKLKRHHITGIAFSGAVGIGILQTSGEIIALGGPVGALLAFIFAGLVIFSVMRCLAEMVSVRPVAAPLIDFPHTFVDEALGFTVGVMYWLANCMSMVTLTIAAAMFTQYWDSNLGITAATFILLLPLFLMNACGVQLYGRMEWVFKWLKFALLFGLILLMILIRGGVGSGTVDSNYEISPGYKPTGFLENDKQPAIPGTGGRILAVWTCTTMAMFQFMGGEIVLVTAGEAKRPMRNLPIAARYMYLLPISFYLVAILFMGLNINYLDPRLYHSHLPFLISSRLEGVQTAARSPFVIVIQNAGISTLPGFLNAAYIFSAVTAANSALYVSSRTLFTLAQRSSYTRIRNTIGRTNNGHTPLAAIAVSFLPGALAFLAVRAKTMAFQELIHVFGRLYTGPMFCVFATQCLSFLRFMAAINVYKKILNRDSDFYRQKHYRAHWQPLWAILGLVLCSLLVIFSGWAAIYDLAANSKNVPRADSIIDLIAAYLGPFLFFTLLITYKLLYGTRIRSIDDMRNAWFVRDASEKEEEENSTAHTTARARKAAPRNRFYEFLSWVR